MSDVPDLPIQPTDPTVEDATRDATRDATVDAAPVTTHPRWVLPLVGALIISLVIAANLGNALWPRLIAPATGHPLLLLALNSSNRYLLLTTPDTAFASFLAVSMFRLLLPDPLFYLLGYLYRGKALHWARRVFPGMDPLFDQFTADAGAFRRVLDVLVLVAPNNPICLLAGVAGMPIRRFVALNLTGTLGRLLLMRGLGTVFSEQIDNFVDVVARYQKWFTVVSIVLVMAYLAYQTIGRKGLIGGVEELGDELGD